ncbi:ROK family protein [Streptomyces sp. NPDC021212]|uniref:ROK family protein n=1 Tax=Streptomyces sp. NPDC021212 TaxID=3365118 RepID=UPI0037B3767C
MHRGADGISGDIAHVRLRGTDYQDRLCGGCGNSDCLGAVVNGEDIAARLAREGLPVKTKWDAIRLAQQGEPRALRAVREAGEGLGEVLAAMVCFHNPDLIVVGGAFAILQDDLLAGIRSVVYERALAQATRLRPWNEPCRPGDSPPGFEHRRRRPCRTYEENRAYGIARAGVVIDRPGMCVCR